MKHDKVPMKARQFLVYWQSLNKDPQLVAGFHTLAIAQRYAALLWANFKWLMTMRIENSHNNDEIVWSKVRHFKESREV